ncbi:hypothetical protein AB870_11300 [Pandoraea faecigallinarum]|uniref:Uncharacterized protein n=2 Tax=Pandoraea faecigallinarum TaxID=656179 RepID=A0A0H3WVB8_9BURK|nr:hypothetical protein AB870_11300 [Pandoraea faecigallinarum]
MAASTGRAYAMRAELLEQENTLASGIARVRQICAQLANALDIVERAEQRQRLAAGPNAASGDTSRLHGAQNFEADMRRCESQAPHAPPGGSALVADSLPSTAALREILRETNDLLSDAAASDIATPHVAPRTDAQNGDRNDTAP